MIVSDIFTTFLEAYWPVQFNPVALSQTGQAWHQCKNPSLPSRPSVQVALEKLGCTTKVLHTKLCVP